MVKVNAIDNKLVTVTAVTHPPTPKEPFYVFSWVTELKEGEARLEAGQTVAILQGERRGRKDIDPIPF